LPTLNALSNFLSTMVSILFHHFTLLQTYRNFLVTQWANDGSVRKSLHIREVWHNSLFFIIDIILQWWKDVCYVNFAMLVVSFKPNSTPQNQLGRWGLHFTYILWNCLIFCRCGTSNKDPKIQNCQNRINNSNTILKSIRNIK